MKSSSNNNIINHNNRILRKVRGSRIIQENLKKRITSNSLKLFQNGSTDYIVIDKC